MGDEGADLAAVEAVRAGDVERFAEIVSRHRDRVFRFVLRHVGDHATAEDLAQEAFLEAFRGIGRFAGRSRFSTWLLGIARNIALNHVNRSPHRRFRFASDEALATVPSRREGPGAALERAEEVAALVRAVDSLPAEMREAVLLVLVEGLPYDEAAEAAGIPSGTMKSRVHRAREALRAALLPVAAGGSR